MYNEFSRASGAPFGGAGDQPASGLRVVMFSGNYNYVRDGANQALNRLVAFLESKGADVRIYSPTSATPAFEPAGTLVSVPSVSIPGRAEYRIARGLPASLKRDIAEFKPHLFHLSAPDPLGHSAKKLAASLKLPCVASIHTRFETYFEYYGFGWARPAGEAILKRFYADLDEIFVTTQGFGDMLIEQGLIAHAATWSRGVDKERFSPARRSPKWRRSLGLADSDVVIGFVGRLVLEKGLDMVAAAVGELKRRGVAHKLLVVGEGPARAKFEAQVPDAIFTGFLNGTMLATAFASADMLINPSITETFGNINIEAMASGIPVIAAQATGSQCIIDDGVTGRLLPHSDVMGFADALEQYLTDHDVRAAAGAAALEAAKAYDWDTINAAVLERYFEIVAAHAAVKA
jgi:glycosyltransferase involved in cell wall biosynthesis